MSGYLQRLVAAAKTTQTAIHPMVGSTLKPTTMSALPFLDEEQDEVVMRLKELAPEQVQESGIATPLIYEDSQFPDLNAEQSPESEIQLSLNDDNSGSSQSLREEIREQSFEALPQPHVAEVAAPYAPENAIVPGRPSQIKSTLLINPTDTITQLKSSRAEQAITEPAFADRPQETFLQPTEASALTAFELKKMVPNGRVGPSTQRERSTSTGSLSGPKQNDKPEEVFIHIGRIEVTAVTPPPAQAPPRPPRKSPSLDEYLQRGRRR